MEETKKKSQTITLVIIGILILIIGVLVGYIVSGKLPAEKPTEEEKVEIEKKLSEEEKEDFMELIKIYNNNFSKYYPFASSSQIPNQELLSFGLFGQLNGDFNNTVTSEQMESYIHKYFGNKKKITHENIKCGMTHPDGQDSMFLYNPTTKVYSYNQNHEGHGAGFEGFADIKNFYVSGSKKENTYTISVKILYGDAVAGDIIPIDCLPKGYYKTQEDAKNETNPLIGRITEPNENVCESSPATISAADYERVKDQIPTTTFTFIKDSDGNYGLTKVTIK